MKRIYVFRRLLDRHHTVPACRTIHNSNTNLSTHAEAKIDATSGSGLKDFSEIPDGMPKNLMTLISSIWNREAMTKQSHMGLKHMHERLGPIFRIQAGVLNMILLNDMDAFTTFIRKEERYPKRDTIWSWKAQWEELGQGYGLLLRYEHFSCTFLTIVVDVPEGMHTQLTQKRF